jgi:hypothetical protein
MTSGGTVKRIDVMKKGDKWVAQSGGSTLAQGTRKGDVVRETARAARSGAEPTSVRIHKLDNTIQEERTYPRSADPRRSKG